MDIGTLTGTLMLEDRMTDALKDATVEIKHFASEFDGMTKVVLTGAIAIVGAVTGITGTIIAMGMHGSTLLGVEDAFNRLAESAGATGEALRGALSEGVKNTVDDFELMQSTMNLLSSGMQITEEQMLTLGEAAREMGKATGTDATHGLDVLSTALTTGNTRALKRLGIQVDLTKAEKDYAASFGRTASELTREGKLEADRIAILKATQSWLDKVGVSQLNFKERIQQTTVAIESWFDNLSKQVSISPHVLAAWDAMANAIKAAMGGSSQTLMEWIIKWINRFADLVATYGPKIVKFFTEAAVYIKKIYDIVIEAFDTVPEWLKEIGFQAAAAASAVYLLATAVKVLAAAEKVAIELEVTKGIIEFASEIKAAGSLTTVVADKMMMKWTSLVTGVGGAFSAIGTIVGETGGLILTFVSNPIGQAIIAITLLTGAIRLLTGSWDFLTVPMKNVAHAMSDVWFVAKELAKTLGSGLVDTVTLLGQAFEDAGKTFGEWGSHIGTVLSGQVHGLWQNLVDLVDILGGDLPEALKKTKDAMNQGLPGKNIGLFSLLNTYVEAKKLAASHELAKGFELGPLSDFGPQGFKMPKSPFGTQTGFQFAGLTPEMERPEGKKDIWKDEYGAQLEAMQKSFREAGMSIKVFEGAFASLSTAQKNNYDVQQLLIPQMEKLVAAHHALTPEMQKEYEQSIAVKESYLAQADGIFKLSGVTLETIATKKALGESELQIATAIGLTVEEFQHYTTILTTHKQITDELTKSQDALNEAMRQSATKEATSRGTGQTEALQAQYNAGLISAQQFATQKVAIENNTAAQIFKIQSEAIDANEAIEKRVLDERMKTGDLLWADTDEREQLITATEKKYANQRVDQARSETDRVQAIRSSGEAGLKQLARQHSDFIKSQTMGDVKFQQAMIWQQAQDSIEAYKGTDEQIAAFTANAEAYAKERMAALVDENKTLLAQMAIYEQLAGMLSTFAGIFDRLASKTTGNLHKITGELGVLASGISDVFAGLNQGGQSFLDYKKALTTTGGKGGIPLSAGSAEVKGVKNYGVATALFDPNASAAQKWASGTASALTVVSGAMNVWAETADAGTKKQGLFMGAMSGAKAGAAFGPWGVAVGAAAGAVVGLIHSLDAGRRAVKDFAASFDTIAPGTGFDELHAQLAVLGDEGDAMWKKLTQQTGRGDKKQAAANIAETQALLESFHQDLQKYNLTLDDVAMTQDKATESGKDLAASYKRLTSAGFTTDKVMTAMSTDLNSYISSALKAGTKIPAAMRPIIEQMIKMGQLSDANAKALLGIATTAMPALEDIRAAADRYGISLDQLGPKVKQLEINELAAQYVSDWNMLTSVTSDWGVLFDKMGPKVQDLVTDAIKFGSELPSNMKPMIEAFVKAGRLTDENGNKLKDLSKLTFAADLAKDFELLMGKLDELIEKIGGGVGGALDALGRRVIRPRIEVDTSGVPDEITPRRGGGEGREGSGPRGPHAAAGGIVAPQPGGTQVTVGEAGQAEAIIPLSRLATTLGGGQAAMLASVKQLASLTTAAQQASSVGSEALLASVQELAAYTMGLQSGQKDLVKAAKAMGLPKPTAPTADLSSALDDLATMFGEASTMTGAKQDAMRRALETMVATYKGTATETTGVSGGTAAADADLVLKKQTDLLGAMQDAKTKETAGLTGAASVLKQASKASATTTTATAAGMMKAVVAGMAQMDLSTTMTLKGVGSTVAKSLVEGLSHINFTGLFGVGPTTPAAPASTTTPDVPSPSRPPPPSPPPEDDDHERPTPPSRHQIVAPGPQSPTVIHEGDTIVNVHNPQVDSEARVRELTLSIAKMIRRGGAVRTNFQQSIGVD